MCDLDYGYMGFTRNIIKIKGKTVQYDDMSLESACENENNVLLIGKYNETHGITLLNGVKNTIENGVYIQNIGKIVLDGTQPLEYHGFSNDTYICAVYTGNSFDSEIYSSIYVEGEYKAISDNIMVPDSNKCGFNNRMGINEGIFMRFPISEVGVNIDQLNNYLKANNHIVYYKLDQPIYNPPNITNINLPQPLRSLPNGVCDEVVGNKLIQNIYELKFDSSFNFNQTTLLNTANTPSDTTLCRFDITLPNLTALGNVNSIISNIFPYLYIHDLPYGSTAVKQECISNHSGDKNKVNVVIKKSRLASVTVDGFKEWCITNNFKILYTLESPIEHTIDINIKKIKKSKCYNKIKPTII